MNLVSFHAIDQTLVNTLCEIIRLYDMATDTMPLSELGFNAKQIELIERIAE